MKSFRSVSVCLGRLLGYFLGRLDQTTHQGPREGHDLGQSSSEVCGKRQARNFDLTKARNPEDADWVPSTVNASAGHLASVPSTRTRSSNILTILLQDRPFGMSLLVHVFSSLILCPETSKCLDG